MNQNRCNEAVTVGEFRIIKFEKTIPMKRNKYEIYTTRNPLIRWIANSLLRKIRDMLKKINSLSLIGLDVGSGEGHMISCLYNEGVIGDMVMIDLDQERLEYAKTHYSFCEYLRTDVNKLPFRANIFDYIIATEILEHLPDPINAMKEIRRISKNNSYIITSVPHEPFFHWGNLSRGKHWKRRGRTPAHVNFWNRSEFRIFLSKFVDIEEEYCMATFPWLLYLGRFKGDTREGYSEPQ